jgi:pilus assembly protein CpaB
MGEIAGSIVRTPFASGEPIREDKLIKAGGSGYMAALLPAGKRAFSFEITPETGVGGFVLPNDRVDLLLTRVQKSSSGLEVYTSDIILTDIRVLAIDQNVEERNGQRVIVGKIATVELTPRQTETLGVARRLGSISLVLRALTANNNTSAPADDDASGLGQSGPINIVRFGNSTVTFK